MTPQVFATTRQFNWQPENHYGPEGSDDFSQWTETDFEAAVRFEALSKQTIVWTKPAADWAESIGLKGHPDWIADTSEGCFVIGENIWIGFPDPPEFTIVKLELAEKSTFHLGHFDHWPTTWKRNAQD